MAVGYSCFRLTDKRSRQRPRKPAYLNGLRVFFGSVSEAGGNDVSPGSATDERYPGAELESEIIGVSRLENLAAAEGELLQRSLKKFNREMTLASSLGLLSIAIAAFTFAIYRHPSAHIPFFVAVFSGAALLIGIAQVGYVVYQLCFGTGSDARNTLFKLSLFITSARAYRRSIQRVRDKLPNRIVLTSDGT
jgi:hypothetical protein